MKHQLNLSIKNPCHENFDTFSSTEKGGFCNACQKEVIDFTKMPSEAVANYFKTNTLQNTCGRFKSSQLQPQISAPKKKSFLSFFGGVGLACLALFSFGTTHAQGEVKIATDSDKDNSKIQDTTNKNTIIVKGTVVEAGLPLPGVNVILKGSSVGTQTDFDGYFEFPEQLKKGDVLVFSYIGSTTQEITIQHENSAKNIELQVEMTSCEMMLLGKVAVKEIYKSNRKTN